jgi:hydroxypyruvate reductase
VSASGLASPANPAAVGAFLRRLFAAAIASAQPEICLPPHLAACLPSPPKGRLIVVGAGKASAAMARAVEDQWQGPLSGLVITRYGHAVPCRRVEIVEAGHPVPDAAGLTATRRLLDLLAGLGPDDCVLCLVSGGGSSLLTLPLPGITLEDKQAVHRALLASGASIAEMNCVRRHLSAVKGGRLAALCHPARVLTLAISDVPGDHPIDIASGPTVADPTTCADALAVLNRYRIEMPAAVRELLASRAGESLKPGDPRLAAGELRLVATPQMALEAAAAAARNEGVPAYILGDAIEGEARELGKAMAGIVRQVVRHGQPFARPCLLLSGGETTVTVRGTGCGGRNVEFLLALALALDGEPGVYALAGDTDGIDGLQETAGATIMPDTLARAAVLGIDARSSLANNDGHGFFSALGDAVVTGPTRTNVNDFRAILIA